MVKVGGVTLWNESGDLATWVQSIGTLLAFWAVIVSLRRERQARRKADLLNIESVGASFLAAAGNSMTILMTHRAVWNKDWLRHGERRAAGAMVERGMLPLFEISVRVSLLGYDELTTAAGRVTDFFEQLGPAYARPDRQWERTLEEFRVLLGDFRACLDDVRQEMA